jgi:uncharacterized membrane protein YcjF (UPF0283 family)
MLSAGLWVAAVVLGVVSVGLAARLWSVRRATNRKWETQDYLAALGIVVSLLGVLVSIILAKNVDGSTESPEVVSYRHDTQAACHSLTAVQASDPVAAAMAAGGDRDVLERGFRSNLDASAEILNDLWKQAVPTQLASDAHAAHEATDELITLTNDKVNKIRTELPDPFTFEQLAAYSATFGPLQVAGARVEAAMSRLAGQSCRAPLTPVTSS